MSKVFLLVPISPGASAGLALMRFVVWMSVCMLAFQDSINQWYQLKEPKQFQRVSMARKTKRNKTEWMLCDTRPLHLMKLLKPHDSEELTTGVPSILRPHLSLIFDEAVAFLFLVIIHKEGALTTSSHSHSFNSAKAAPNWCDAWNHHLRLHLRVFGCPPSTKTF